MRPSSSAAFSPLYCQATAITGMLMVGKMSVGVRAMTTGLTMRIRRARTMKVYGRSSAILTIHMAEASGRGGPAHGEAILPDLVPSAPSRHGSPRGPPHRLFATGRLETGSQDLS